MGIDVADMDGRWSKRRGEDPPQGIFKPGAPPVMALTFLFDKDLSYTHRTHIIRELIPIEMSVSSDPSPELQVLFSALENKSVGDVVGHGATA